MAGCGDAEHCSCSRQGLGTSGLRSTRAQPWKVTDAEGNVTTTPYYPDGKVWKVIDAKGNVAQYEYNGFMALARTTYPDDTYEELTYDEYRRVIETRGRSGQTISLTYDGLNRVSTKTVRDPNFVLANTITYQYDLLGRLYKVTDNTGTTSSKGREISS
ncbi:MAG: hypothetical protein NTZ17_17690 [Phycisphaerae bacterium]|nr:hypothetical protein [Phycisphaerae bacterium]